MSIQNLTSDADLRSACEAIGPSEKWRADWADRLAKTLSWFRSASEEERAKKEFQQTLWEDNNVAAIGQGNIPIKAALDDRDFRRWFATMSMEPLPAAVVERPAFIEQRYELLKNRLEPFVRKTPHLKIFRVLTVLYPEVMTTVASSGKLSKLARAMGGDAALGVGERHVWVRSRLDHVLGDTTSDAAALAERLVLPWLLYQQFCEGPRDQRTVEEIKPGSEARLLPLPAARRRRGLTPIKGLFVGALSVLEFIRDGVTRQALLDFLRAASPDSKGSTLGMTINVLQSELGAIEMHGERYVLTARGRDVLESEDASDLSDWLLTRILGVDFAIATLRDDGPTPPAIFLEIVRAANPGWTIPFVPQSITNWLRSMGVIQTDAEGKYMLTEVGHDWGAKIHWQPESLPAEQPKAGIVTVVSPLGAQAEVVRPTLEAILGAVQERGTFDASTIASLHAGLWSHVRRHFAILTGLSGSGKTMLACAYAEAIVDGDSDRRLLTLPVQPGWHDPGALLGFPNPLRTESYVSTPFLEFLTNASADPTRPYIVVLDEMNLSHPEQYMAPLLSAMETGKPIQLHTEDEFMDGIPRALPYPQNLVVIGTVNMDETTHGLSDKVLDRAFVLEFWEVNLDEYPRWKRLGLTADQTRRTKDLLGALMASLAPARLHFGWRVVDDTLEFLRVAVAGGVGLSFDAALDAVVYSKILPKLRGEDAPRVRQALASCGEALKVFGLSRSLEKVQSLRHDLETTGSARFWR